MREQIKTSTIEVKAKEETDRRIQVSEMVLAGAGEISNVVREGERAIKSDN